MAITTNPIFYFIGPVTTTNFQLDFVEPNISAAELTADLNAGSRSHTELAEEVERALNAAGQQTYTVTFDRDTRIYTIASDDTIELLASSGTNVGTSAYSLLGYDATDLTGASSYAAQNAAGSQYEPLFPLQTFRGFEDIKEGILPSINESASGEIEVITYGERQFMEFNITFITNETWSKSSIVRSSATAIEDARTFLDFLITKSNLEFMKDSTDRNTFDTILLERTRQSRTGTGYQLTELYNLNLLGYYETGILRFRKVT